MAWVNLYSGASCHCAPLSGRDDGPQEGYIFYADPGPSNWQFWTGSGSGWTNTSNGGVAQDEWTLLVGTYDRTAAGQGTKTLYVNNEAPVIQNNQGYQYNEQRPLRIGAGANENVGGNYFWDGLIDEVGVFKEVLEPEKVEEIYSIGKTRKKS